MVSAWLWKSVNLQYSLYFNLTSYPMKWNKKEKKFAFDFEGYGHYLPWMFNVMFMLGVTMEGTLISIVYLFFTNDQATVQRISLPYIMLYTVVSFGILFPIVITIGIPLYGSPMVMVNNNVISMNVQLKYLKLKGRASTGKHENIERDKVGEKVDALSLVSYLVIKIIAVLPIVIPVLAALLQINPYLILLDVTFPAMTKSYFLVKVLVYIFAYILLFICCCEGFRLVPLILIYVLYPCALKLRNLKLLDEVHSVTGHLRSGRKVVYIFYSILYILMKVAGLYSASLGFWIQLAGKLLFALLFLCSVRFVGRLDRIIYPFVPLSASMIAFLSMSIGTVASGLPGKCSKVLNNWAKGSKYYHRIERRKLKAMRPLSFTFGIFGFNFYEFNSEAFTEWIHDTLKITVDLLINIQ